MKITLKAAVAGVRKIVLHANDLEISTYSLPAVLSGSRDPINFLPEKYDPVTDKWTIDLVSDLSTTTTTVLTVNYKGYMRDDMNGFYRSYYLDSTKAKKWIATTQFQQTEARRAFPCFDVSLCKVSFRLIFNIHIFIQFHNYKFKYLPGAWV